MKKGLYLLYEDINEQELSGIQKKILLQFSLFEKSGIQMEFKTLPSDSLVCWKNPRKYACYDFIYFRKQTIIDLSFLTFFRRIKKINHNILIFMEIPTYPYEGEFLNGVRGNITLFIDRIFRNGIRTLIDRVVITGADEKIEYFGGVKAINIVNGIDVKNIKYLPRKKYDKNEIIIGCIGKLSPWHGYERLLLGLSQYYANYREGERKVYVYIVGNGPEENNYRKIVAENRLEEYVRFFGFVTGNRLEEIYSCIDFGCCSLGRYKSGNNVIGDLKSRDYLARGISLITGCSIDILRDSHYPYMVQFPNDDSSIDLHRIVEYCNVYDTKSDELRTSIVMKTQDIIDFNNTFNPVIQELRDLQEGR